MRWLPSLAVFVPEGRFSNGPGRRGPIYRSGRGDVVVIPGGAEHEAWFREDTEVIDFFAPPRDDFLLGGKPASMSEG